MQAAARSPIGMMKNFIQSQAAGKSMAESSSATSEELRMLRERIAELQSRMKKPKGKKPPQKRKAVKR